MSIDTSSPSAERIGPRPRAFAPAADVAKELEDLAARLLKPRDECPHPWAERDIRVAIDSLDLAIKRLRSEHHS